MDAKRAPSFHREGTGRCLCRFMGMRRLRVDSGGVGQQIALGLGAPQAVVGGAQLGQLGEERIGLALLGEIVNGGQRQIDVGVDQLLAAGDLGQVFSGFDDGVQAADMGDHAGGSEAETS